MPQTLDLSSYRRYFPSLELSVHDKQVVYFDNPGGTQVARQVIDAIVVYFQEANANIGGAFVTSQRADALIEAARSAMADFLHAASSRQIVFGPNMTTLTFAFSRAIGKTLSAGDEIVVTGLDHDANVAPWLALQERGVVIRTVDIHPENVTLDMDDMRAKITERTRLVAVGYASNAVGTINDVQTVIRWAHEVGALVWVDAVQFAPHGPIDVQALDADFLVCSRFQERLRRLLDDSSFEEIRIHPAPELDWIAEEKIAQLRRPDDPIVHQLMRFNQHLAHIRHVEVTDIRPKQSLEPCSIWIHFVIETPRIYRIIGFAAEVEIARKEIANIGGLLDLTGGVVVNFIRSARRPLRRHRITLRH